MKQEIFKRSFEKYMSLSHAPYNDLKTERKELGWLDLLQFDQHYQSKRPQFKFEETFYDKETYLKNYGNPLYAITKYTLMVVVEKIGDKVAIKLFQGIRERKAGNTWFSLNKHVDYISVNIKTGDVYCGFIHNYNKKRKCTKSVRRNFFFAEPINKLSIKLKNTISTYFEDAHQIAIDAISAFMREIDLKEDFCKLSFEKRLLKFYLDKRNIKYPNNFHAYSGALVGPEIKKILKKNGNKLVEALMTKLNLSGKKLKSALHECDRINSFIYIGAKELFGEDWLNQDNNIILPLLNSHSYWTEPPDIFKETITREELRRVYEIFKEAYVYNTLDYNTFHDHIMMYSQLKMYGEQSLKWLSGGDSKKEFREEHLDWSDKVQHYKQGHYTRIYPEYMYNAICSPIEDFYPVLLDNTTNYNQESQTQSNCVKTYICQSDCFIVSLRKGSLESDERATIEYRFTKENDKISIKRYQTLGKYNRGLTLDWDDIILKLDDQVMKILKNKKFETVKINKKCNNGIEVFSDSYWDDFNRLKWSNQLILN